MTVVGRDGEKVMLRLPPGVRDGVKALASENRRSMNSEIVTILEAAVSSSPQIQKAAEPRA